MFLPSQLVLLILVPVVGGLTLRILTTHKQLISTKGRDVYLLLGIYGITNYLSK